MNKAFVFDFDDTLAKTKATVIVNRPFGLSFRLSAIEFNQYKLQTGESFDFSEFKVPELVMDGKPTYLINLAKEVYEENHSVYILTAREDEVSDAIHSWLDSHGIKAKTIFCVGGTTETISKNKRKVLLSIMEQYDKVYFYDDCSKNIENAPNGFNFRKYKV
tara:strand:+ start:21 stop:506 length:486 start_codon:yes stop_codon:yes gene_type:complete